VDTYYPVFLYPWATSPWHMGSLNLLFYKISSLQIIWIVGTSIAVTEAKQNQS
jgi:hypothetical protein